MSRLGLSSFAYYWSAKGSISQKIPPWTAGQLLERVAALDLGVLQLCDHVPLLDCEDFELQQLRDAAENKGVVLEAGAQGLSVEYLSSYVEIAHSLGSHILRVVPWTGSEDHRELSVDRVCDVIRQLMPLCRQLDVTLALENHFDLSDENLVALIRRIDDDRVGICLDTANSTGLLAKPLDTVAMLAPYCVSLHLKDFAVRKIPGMGYRISGVPLGQGWVDVPAVLAAVARTGREPNVLLELWVEPADSYEETLQIEDEWVRQSIACARKHLSEGSTITETHNTRR